MTVVILERVAPSLRGYLSRWLIEPKSGVFVGSISALVRDELWEKVKSRLGKGAAVQIWSTNNEQGFAMRLAGERDRVLVDYEGLTLVKRLVKSNKY